MSDPHARYWSLDFRSGAEEEWRKVESDRLWKMTINYKWNRDKHIIVTLML